MVLYFMIFSLFSASIVFDFPNLFIYFVPQKHCSLVFFFCYISPHFFCGNLLVINGQTCNKCVLLFNICCCELILAYLGYVWVCVCVMLAKDWLQQMLLLKGKHRERTWNLLCYQLETRQNSNVCKAVCWPRYESEINERTFGMPHNVGTQLW